MCLQPAEQKRTNTHHQRKKATAKNSTESEPRNLCAKSPKSERIFRHKNKMRCHSPPRMSPVAARSLRLSRKLSLQSPSTPSCTPMEQHMLGHCTLHCTKPARAVEESFEDNLGKRREEKQKTKQKIKNQKPKLKKGPRQETMPRDNASSTLKDENQTNGDGRPTGKMYMFI
jgi:hypothetical protein